MALNGLFGRGGGFPSSPATDDSSSTDGYGGPPLLSIPPTTPVDSNPGANSVAEGAAVNTQVGITASSHSLLDLFPVTYSLGADSSHGGFKIDPNTGVVTVADPSKIDFETSVGHAYTITVNASDLLGTSSQSFTINVTDVAPSTPVDINPAANTVAEGAAVNTLVGITASSTDVNGPAVTWSLSADSSGGGFKIDSVTGVISVADSTKIDYETSPGHAYTVTVTASDGGTLSSSQNFTINVTDVLPSTPTDSDLATNTVVEHAVAGTHVGVTVSSTDVNGPAVSYSLSNNANGAFQIDATTGVVTVLDPTKIDYATAPGHALTITAVASDGAGVSSQNFTIAVTDIAPTTPVDSNGAANTVAEGAAAGTSVGITAHSTDPDVGETISYSLTNNANGAFQIDAVTGVVTVADPTKLDYETAAGHAYTITVQASDGGATSSQNFTIAVTDPAPSAPVDSNAAANTVAEGAAVNTLVGITASSTVAATDPAATYSLTADSSNGGFKMIGRAHV